MQSSAAPVNPEQKIAPLNKDTGISLVTDRGSGTAVLYVNSKTGNDSSGTGTAKNPFKTITHTMEVARSGMTIIVEAANTYDEANGEVFPIQMKSGVTLTGKKPGTLPSVSSTLITPLPVICGGAMYDIPDSDVERYVTILGADRATISGLSFRAIRTPDGLKTGTLIMCNSTSPTIMENTFSGTGHAGVTAMGIAHPTITKNNFTGDLDWGVTAYGESYPSVRSNTFSCTDGMDCTAKSHSLVDQNTFSCLHTGFSTKGSADATFINNVVKANGEYGIVVRMNSTPMFQGNKITQNPVGIYITTSQDFIPDIGGGGRSTGGNTFDNYDYDIENQCHSDISAEYNTWGTTCCEEIKEKIYDRDDNPLFGIVHHGSCIRCSMIMPLNTS